jgi:hypothetical protein
MWTYEQKTGRTVDENGHVVATGYSGFGEGKNNPTEETIRNVGPIPEGFYDIQSPVDAPLHGPYTLQLLPDVENVMYGRSGFLIHGDSKERPGQASEGCIILPRFARERIWESGDHRLRVVKELETTT